MSVICILWAAAFITTILHRVTGRVPLDLAVLLVALAGLLSCLPLR